MANPAHGRISFMNLTAKGTAVQTIQARGDMKVQLFAPQPKATDLLAKQFMRDFAAKQGPLKREPALAACQAHFVTGTCSERMALRAFLSLDPKHRLRGAPKRS
jgi:hypothetical protein